MKTRVTRQRLEFLLKNWGAWESSVRLGPRMAYHTVDREYARLRSALLDSGSTVPRGTADTFVSQEFDPALGQLAESAIVQLPKQCQRAIELWYARGATYEGMAAAMRMSRISANALLDTAIVEVWHVMEDMTWAHGV